MALTTVNPAMIGQTSTGAASLTATGSAAASLVTAAGTALNANSSGQVTMPFQPAFFARRSSSYNITANIGTAQLDQTLLNVGNCFNTSTYRFTAPIAGNYFISASMSFTGMNATQTYLGAMIQKNGSNFISGYDCSTQTGNVYKLITINFIVPLAANDYITMLWDFNTGTAVLNHDDSRTHLMGWLVS